MSSLSDLNYAAFAPHVSVFPTIADYFGQGQQAVSSVLDQQYQAQVRQQLLAEQQRKADMETLLGPVQVAQAQANVAGTTTRTAAEQQAINQGAQTFPLTINRLGLENTRLGYDNSITSAQLPFAAPTAALKYAQDQVGVGQALQAAGPVTSTDANGNTTVIRPAVPLPGPSVASIQGGNDLPQDSSAPPSPSLFGPVRTTTYGINDSQSDPETAAGQTSTGAPVIPASPGMAGTAAVDPAQIPYGSIIKLKDGSTYVAGDTGGAVKAQTASQGQAPVIDLVGKPGSVADWNDVSITPPTADYLHLSPSQKLAYHAAAASGTTSAPPDTGNADTVPVSQDGGYLDRAISQMQNANPATANLMPSAGTSGGITSNGLLASNVAPISAFQTVPVAAAPSLDLSNLAPIGAKPGIAAPASISPPAKSVVAPQTTTGLIPLFVPTLNTPGNLLHLPPQENAPAKEALKDAADKGVDARPYKIEPGPGSPNGALDVTGLQAAIAAKTQGLTISRLQQEFQNNKDVQAFHTAAAQANSIADNLNNFPFATRTAENDNAVEKSAAGTELPGQAVSQPSLNSVASGQTYGEKFDNFLSKTPVLGLWNEERSVLPVSMAPGANVPSQPRNLSDRSLRNTADTVQSKVQSVLPAYQGVLDQYRAQAKAEGLDPDSVFPPASQQPLINAATRPMYPGAGAQANTAPSSPALAPLPQPKSKAERDALAPGSQYLAPDGTIRTR